MADVYPALKDYCRETHGLEFQASVSTFLIHIHNEECQSLGKKLQITLSRQDVCCSLPPYILICRPLFNQRGQYIGVMIAYQSISHRTPRKSACQYRWLLCASID